MAVSELLEHRADMMITGGVDTDSSILAYLCFSKTPALSKKQQSRPFDIKGDGMMLGEGIGMMVLKRVEDAERDGDRIYAVIKGIGTSSDGKYKSIYAPRPEGQVKALHRAYEEAGFEPTSVSLIEAHGTGTLAGDPSEFTALKQVFRDEKANSPYIALGSVKSQIGHTKAAAGAASLIKTALALHHKILPPTINITKPNPKLNIEATPFYLNTEARPWIRAKDNVPRRAGVSSFGFGGTNYHVVLEEYTQEQESAYRLHHIPQPVLLFAATQKELIVQGERILSQLQGDTQEKCFAELIESYQGQEIPIDSARVGFVAVSAQEACQKLAITLKLLKTQTRDSWEHPQGIYYRQSGMNLQGKIVALFAGQGSQYLEMGRSLTNNFPCLRQVYSELDNLLIQDGLQPVSTKVFPPPVFETAERDSQEEQLQRTEYSQPAIGAFSVGLYKLLQQSGFKPDFAAGHSFGELTALWAAEVLSDEDYFFLVKTRGQVMSTPNDPQFDAGTMMAVTGDVSKIEQEIAQYPQIKIANFNSPQQVVLAGAKAQIAKIEQILTQKGYLTTLLSVGAAFHTPLVSYAQKPLATAIEKATFKTPKLPVYSNITGKAYPSEPQAIQKMLKEHLLNQVVFQQQIENIYDQGGFCFVEFGPRRILTNLVQEILGDRPHLAIPLNPSRQQDSDRSLREAIVQLQVAGLSLQNLDPYQIPSSIGETQTSKGLTVRLNGSNYVSDKTKKVFEQALGDGKERRREKGEGSRGARLAPWEQKVGSKEIGKLSDSFVQTSSLDQATQIQIMPVVTTINQPNSELKMNYQQVLESLEYSIAQFHQHQQETLKIHGQYLNNQLEYAKIFLQLIQQKCQLLEGNNSQAKPLESAQTEANLVTLEAEKLLSNLDSVKLSEQVKTEIQSKEEALINSESKHNNGSASAELKVINTTKTDLAIKIDSPLQSPATNGFKPKDATTSESLISTSLVPPPELETKSQQSAIEKSETSETSVAKTVSESLDFDNLSQTLLEVVSDKTGYPTEMLELDMDMEADLGIDSIKRVEILGAMQERFPDAPQTNPEDLAELRTLGQIIEHIRTISSGGNLSPDYFVAESLSLPRETHQLQDSFSFSEQILVEQNNNGFQSLPKNETATLVASEIQSTFSEAIALDMMSRSLLEVVSDKTGYPAEMLELDMDMEADLGIDSIKRVEILGAMQEQFPDAPQTNPEDLAELRTLGQIIDYMEQQIAEKKSPPLEMVANSIL
jgi:acyl transferase domain-containing protein